MDDDDDDDDDDGDARFGSEVLAFWEGREAGPWLPTLATDLVKKKTATRAFATHGQTTRTTESHDRDEGGADDEENGDDDTLRLFSQKIES